MLASAACALKRKILRASLRKVNEFLFFWLWRVRFRVMAILAFIMAKVLDAYIGAIISSIFMQ
ncbi:hypothetical protein [Novosphingobium sp. PY1]|uniref:hypothetical protein n=1 Tax=Novosphingobium sp. PY1 TaxID=1882221 RepID=UPI001A8D76D8|nr:hypothetical protein [Novosphingobium sp. PY1]